MAVFSVIIPVYNVEKYLEQCVRSVQQQAFKDIEIILIDDGSTDRSGQLCDKFAQQDSRIKVIHQTNGGLGEARNTGLKEATGEWILFLDSDDFWEEDCLEKLYEKMQQLPGQQLYVGKWKRFRNPESKEDADPIGYEKEEVKQFLTLYDRIQFYESVCGWAVWKLVISRQLIEQKQIYFLPEVRNGEDLYWVTLLFSHISTVGFLNVVLCCYRQQERGTLSERSAVNALKWLASLLITIEQLRHRHLEDEEKIFGWLMDTVVYYLILAADKKQKAQWMKFVEANCDKLAEGFKMASSKKGKLLNAASCSLAFLWTCCRAARKWI